MVMITGSQKRHPVRVPFLLRDHMVNDNPFVQQGRPRH